VVTAYKSLFKPVNGTQLHYSLQSPLFSGQKLHSKGDHNRQPPMRYYSANMEVSVF